MKPVTDMMKTDVLVISVQKSGVSEYFTSHDTPSHTPVAKQSWGI